MGRFRPDFVHLVSLALISECFTGLYDCGQRTFETYTQMCDQVSTDRTPNI